MNIVIAGIGGVGGYFGGLLARYYRNHPEVKVSFFARGENLQSIRENGLRISKGQEEWIAYPHKISDKAEELGDADLLVLACKSYSLASMLNSLDQIISPTTIILPLLNGVDSYDVIKSYFRENTVLYGCVYLVSRLIAPGVVENSGNVETLFFGLPKKRDEELIYLEKLFQAANIQATCTPVIEQVVWEKFLFVSPIATATSYFNESIGNILNDKEKKSALHDLIEEIHRLASAKGIFVAADLIDRTIVRLSALPYETTSSMQADFAKGHVAEWKSLTQYVVVESEACGLEATTYSKMLKELMSR